MFVLSNKGSNYRHHLYDTDTLEDLLLAVTGDKSEAKRIANIAGSMRFGDVFHNDDIYLKCKEED